MADVGVELSQRAARTRGHLLPAGLAMTGRPGLAGELGERDCLAVTSRDWVVLRKYEVDRVAPQVLPVDARRSSVRLVRPFVGQDQVDVPDRQRRE